MSSSVPPTPSPASGQTLSGSSSIGRPYQRLSRSDITKQVDEANLNAPVGYSTISELPKIVWQKRRFVLESQIQQKNSRGRRSWIGSHGFFLVELNPDETINESVWACQPCDKRGKATFFKAQGTSSAIDHLRKQVIY
ncbi:hypothetical protein P885DRAFT_33005 [Corynascus similis CBS 632.67]